MFRQRQLLIFLSLLVVIFISYYFLALQSSYRINPELYINHIYNEKFEVNSTKCETIHVGIVYTGSKSNLNFYISIKSILFKRQDPLHLHIIVDDMSERILRTLFETWLLIHVNVTFYNINNYAKLRWCTFDDSYCSELFKLSFPEVIPLNITNRIIITDSDLLFPDDIYELWLLFRNFSNEHVIGLAENNRHICNDASLVQTRTEEQFSTDVILYNLQMVTKMPWSEIVDEVIFSNKSKWIANKALISSAIKHNLNIVHRLPCIWDTQLEHTTNTCNCSERFWRINSSQIFNANNTFYKTIFTNDMNELEQRLRNCQSYSDSTTNTPEDQCSYFHRVQTQKWRTLLFFRRYTYDSTTNDVTFVSQLSYERLEILEELSERWKGPMSLTLYVNDSELFDSLKFIEGSERLNNRFNIAYHAVFKEGTHYPVNELRNVALRNVNTPYVFLIDIDFLPTSNTYVHLKEQISRQGSMDRKALVVAAFETNTKIPATKQELLNMLLTRTILPFDAIVFPPAHFPTNYAEWLTSKEPYKVKWKQQYEPYIVVQKNVTEYDRRFFGYGWNKVSHILELHLQGYQFVVLSDVFITHKDHQKSEDKVNFLKIKTHYKCLQKFKIQFRQELNVKYNVTSFNTG